MPSVGVSTGARPSPSGCAASATARTWTTCGLHHNYGCSAVGDDYANTQRALAALVRHPNAGAVLVLGLGCENNQVAASRRRSAHGMTSA